jgi:methionine synthase II (cobalamin-independent)
LKEAYGERDQGKISAEELGRIEDEAIRTAVKLQEEIGLDVITDGEFRRLNFQDSFAASVSGFDARRVDLAFVESLVREGKPLQRWDPTTSRVKARRFYSAVRFRKNSVWRAICHWRNIDSSAV